eukprot:scaffold172655_cov19-Tisochrysis_lutea.AAC.1
MGRWCSRRSHRYGCMLPVPPKMVRVVKSLQVRKHRVNFDRKKGTLAGGAERISSDSVLNSLNCNTQGAPLNKDTWCSKALKHQKGDAKPRVLEPGLISEAH